MRHDIILKGYGAFMPTTPSKMLCLGTAESYGIEQLNIIPGAGWEGLVIKATFHPASSEPVVMVVGENGGVIDVPPEATMKATAESSPGVIVFSGVADGVQRISANLAYTVIGHAAVDGKDSEPTPSQWEQLAAQYQSKVDKQQGAENAGKVLGIGEDGLVKPVEQTGGGSDTGSGISTQAKNLLITVLRNAIYSTNQSANITALENALGGGTDEPDVPDIPDVPDVPDEPDEPDIPVVKTYTITRELINVTSNNNQSSITEGASYTATLTADDGYVLDSVTVTMGGVDVTADVYADGVIAIASVTGNIEIVASAVIEEKEAVLPTDGLLTYFDFRTTPYNNAGAGGSTTIAATQGNGQLFAWAKNGVEVQDERGIHFANTRKMEYSQAGNTTATDVGSTMTLIMLTYGHVMDQGFSYKNTPPSWQFQPQYKNTSGGTVYAQSRGGDEFNADDRTDYNFCVYRVDGNILTEIMDTSVTTYNGGDIDGFVSWKTTVGVQVVSGADDGVYCTSAAIYNRALTDAEIEEAREFMKALEVTA